MRTLDLRWNYTRVNQPEHNYIYRERTRLHYIPIEYINIDATDANAQRVCPEC